MIKTILKIDGMVCYMCESHVNDVLRRAFDVKKVTSSHKKGVTEIISDAVLNEEKLKSAIGETGYTVISVNSEPYVMRGLFHH